MQKNRSMPKPNLPWWKNMKKFRCQTTKIRLTGFSWFSYRISRISLGILVTNVSGWNQVAARPCGTCDPGCRSTCSNHWLCPADIFPNDTYWCAQRSLNAPDRKRMEFYWTITMTTMTWNFGIRNWEPLWQSQLSSRIWSQSRGRHQRKRQCGKFHVG